LQAGETFVAGTLGNLKFETDSLKAVGDTDLVIEAIVENLDVKKKLFSALDKAAPRFV
jgi:3-hydroxyacyl-CoA dehydrogenase